MPNDKRIPYEDTYGNWDNMTTIPVIDLVVMGAVTVILAGVLICEVLGWL